MACQVLYFPSGQEKSDFLLRRKAVAWYRAACCGARGAARSVPYCLSCCGLFKFVKPTRKYIDKESGNENLLIKGSVKTTCNAFAIVAAGVGRVVWLFWDAPERWG